MGQRQRQSKGCIEPTKIAEMLRTFDTFEATHGRPPRDSDELKAFLEGERKAGRVGH